MTPVSQILASLQRKNIEVRVHAGALHYRAPRAALAAKDERVLKARSREILLELINHGAPKPAAVSSVAIPQLAPLTLQQKFALTHAGDMFFSTFAIRLTGQLKLARLRDSLCALVHRHDALRTQIVLEGGALTSQVRHVACFPLRLVDLRSAHRVDDAEIQAHIRAAITQWLDEGDSAFATVLFKIADDEHVLLIHWDHLATDHVSCVVLFQELWQLYGSSCDARQRLLSRNPLQHSQYAAWQRDTYPIWLAKHGGYWERRLPDFKPLQLLFDDGLNDQPKRLASLDLSFGTELSRVLRELARHTGIALPLIAFSLISLALSRWCGQEHMTIPMSFSGRFRADHLRVIGYLPNFPLLTIEMTNQATFTDLFKGAALQFFSAIQHLNIGATVGQSIPGLLQGPLFQWFPSSPVPACVVTPHPAEFDPENQKMLIAALRPEWQPPPNWTSRYCFLLMIALWDSSKEIGGVARYRQDLFAMDTVTRLWQDVVLIARHVTRDPGARIGSLEPRAKSA